MFYPYLNNYSLYINKQARHIDPACHLHNSDF